MWQLESDCNTKCVSTSFGSAWGSVRNLEFLIFIDFYLIKCNWKWNLWAYSVISPFGGSYLHFIEISPASFLLLKIFSIIRRCVLTMDWFLLYNTRATNQLIFLQLTVKQSIKKNIIQRPRRCINPVMLLITWKCGVYACLIKILN